MIIFFYILHDIFFNVVWVYSIEKYDFNFEISIFKSFYDWFEQDNPLSALDTDVGQHVLFNGIKKSTLNQIKTVIMTTSFASDLSLADTVRISPDETIQYYF